MCDVYGAMTTNLANLEAWLRQMQTSGGGSTLLVPLRKESKQPLVAHSKPRAWTWETYDAFVRANPEHSSWGLLLDGLCVVDADDAESVEWLEGLAGSIPELARCPVQLTNKGRHYFFIRPAWADTEGYYDGARQCTGHAVDLKTRCQTGTRGLLVVAPTPGKRWADGRAPWECLVGMEGGVQLEEVPRALLELVAKPKKKLVQGGPRTRVVAMHSDAPNVHAIVSLPSVNAASSDTVVKMLHLLSKTRWDTYASWRDIATILKNEAGNKYLSEWLRLSRASAKYDHAAAVKLWESVGHADYEGPRLTLGTLKRWAKTDDPLGMQAMRAAAVAPLVLAKYGEGDRGLAEIAHHVMKDVIKRVGTKDAYIYYFEEESCRWRRGTEASVMQTVSYAVEDVLRDVDAYLGAQAAATTDDAQRVQADAARKHVAQSIRYIRKRGGMSAVTNLLVLRCQDDNFDQQLDSKPYLLGVRNGVVDLRTGELRRRVPEDMILTVLDVEYDAAASTTLIEDTVSSIMADDLEMAAFMQKLLGYAVTGEVSEEIFVVFTANGRNGKGLLMQALMNLLDKPFYSEMNCGVIVNRQVANIDAERGKLLGARVAVFNELEPGEKLKTSEVQQLCGGDGIPATPKYRDPMTLVPRFLLILCTNHLPELTEVVTAILERMIVIHFPVTFADLAEGEAPTPTRRQRDNDLKRKLMDDKQGLLRYLVVGAVAWYASKDLKRNAPAQVKEFSRKYFEEQDRLAMFVREQCIVSDDSFVPTQDFLRELNAWSDGSPMDSKKVVSAMKNKGFLVQTKRVLHRGTPRCYVGLRLLDTECGGIGGDELEP